jgi:hypothetical protein
MYNVYCVMCIFVYMNRDVPILVLPVLARQRPIRTGYSRFKRLNPARTSKHNTHSYTHTHTHTQTWENHILYIQLISKHFDTIHIIIHYNIILIYKKCLVLVVLYIYYRMKYMHISFYLIFFFNKYISIHYTYINIYS